MQKLIFQNILNGWQFSVLISGCLFFLHNQGLSAQDYAVVSSLPGRNWDTCRVVQSRSFAEVSFKPNTSTLLSPSSAIVASKNIDDKKDAGSTPVPTQSFAAKKETVTSSQLQDSKLPHQNQSKASEPKLLENKSINQPNQEEKKEQRVAASSVPTDSKTPAPAAEHKIEATPKKEEKTSELGEEYMGAVPKYYALIIGVDKYKNDEIGLPSLDYPVKDAKRFKQVLTEKYAFDEVSIKLLENPVRSSIIDSFEELSSKVTEKYNLLIFYAGHGFYDKDKGFGYWLPADAKTQSKSDWISNTIVRDYLGAIKAKHTLLISDACFSGSIFKSRNVMANMMAKISEMYKYPSRRAMTSGNLSQVPDKSYFADYLVKRLMDNTDAFLPAQTLFYRIFEPVNNNSPATPQFGVVQGTGDEGGDFIFIKRTKK